MFLGLFSRKKKTQADVSSLTKSLQNDYNATMRDPKSRTRFFVQLDGCRMNLDLDASDKPHTVQRKVQLTLNVPKEETSTHDCHSPTEHYDIQPLYSSSSPIEIIGMSSTYCDHTRQLVEEVVNGINNGVDPIVVHGGLGGAYCFRNSKGENVAIIKPIDEEPFAPNNPNGYVGKELGQPGIKSSVRIGETGFREAAAYLLDYDHFAKVPPTILVNATHSIFNVNETEADGNNDVECHSKHPKKAVRKLASLQKFIHHDCDASDYGTSRFPVDSLHRMGILDIRILNTDRHAGNILVRRVGEGFGGQLELIPIDHGLCLPEALEDPYFEWLYWPQASIPFSEEEIEYIGKLDPFADANMLREVVPGIREGCLRVLVICTVFLKEAVEYGLCLAKIGEMMSREFEGDEEVPSKLEAVCMEARRLIGEKKVSEVATNDDLFYNKPLDSGFGSRGGRCERVALSNLMQIVNEQEDNDGVDNSDRSSNIPSRWLDMVLPRAGGISMGKSCPNNNNNKNNLPSGSPCFVTVADMGEDIWAAFLEKFQELLPSAIFEHKSKSAGCRQKLRLGDSNIF